MELIELGPDLHGGRDFSRWFQEIAREFADIRRLADNTDLAGLLIDFGGQ